MKGISRFVRNVPLALWTVLVLGPFLLILTLSLRDNVGIFTHPFGLGGEYHFENYAAAWTGPSGAAGMANFTMNTVLTASVTLGIVIIAGSLAGFFVTALAAFHRRIVLGCLIALSVLPFTVILIPLFRVFDGANLLSQPIAVGVLYAALALPFVILILQAHFRDFPRELIEAAGIDGLGPYGTFVRIVMPLSVGPIIAVCMITTIFVWGEAQLGIVLLQEPTSQTISVGLLGYRGQWFSELGPQYAGLAIGAFPVILLYLLLNRYVTKGLALGGVSR